jgi:L-ascorbate metabolism protein UlaG (beta-lactamase superfamily)
MKLDYIYHSGFAIEADGVTVIIDYYKDSSEEVFNKGIVHDYLLEKPGVLYVLCSHFHPDHFNREVLSWKKLRPDIRYIFSKDIHSSPIPTICPFSLSENTTRLVFSFSFRRASIQPSRRS